MAMRGKWALMAVALGIVAALAIVAVETLVLRAPRTPEIRPGAAQFLYIFMSPNEMMEQADAIFMGTVSGISPTRWNQDSGEPYPCEPLGDCPLELHYIEVQITRPLVDTIGLGETITLTVLGASPLDVSEAEHDLQVGDQALFFVRQTEVGWRGGETRPAIMFMTAPGSSYFKYGDDGLYHYTGPEPATYTLEELIAQIGSKRLLVPQPDQ